MVELTDLQKSEFKNEIVELGFDRDIVNLDNTKYSPERDLFYLRFQDRFYDSQVTILAAAKIEAGHARLDAIAVEYSYDTPIRPKLWLREDGKLPDRKNIEMEVHYNMQMIYSDELYRMLPVFDELSSLGINLNSSRFYPANNQWPHTSYIIIPQDQLRKDFPIGVLVNLSRNERTASIVTIAVGETQLTETKGKIRYKELSKSVLFNRENGNFPNFSTMVETIENQRSLEHARTITTQIDSSISPPSLKHKL